MSATLYFINRNNMQPVNIPGEEPFETPEMVRPWDSDLDCNMGNRNARLVLSALGLNSDLEDMPQFSVQELWAACGLYLTSHMEELVDNGFESTVNDEPGKCLVIEGGLRPGYITERIAQIKAQCELVMQHNATHAYFA